MSSPALPRLTPAARRAFLLVGGSFLLGLYLQDRQVSQADEDRIVAERVAKRLGEWTPPVLSAHDRLALMAERDELLEEVAKSERRLAEAREKKGGR
jgi:hypothetical protein